MFEIAVDTGGTFTDSVLIDEKNIHPITDSIGKTMPLIR